MRVCAAKEKCHGRRDRQIGRVLLRCATFVLAGGVVPAMLLSGCGGGGEGGTGSGSQAPFTVAAESSVNGTQASSLLLPVDLTRHPGFTDTVTVTLENLPAGVVADTIVFSGETASALLPITVTQQAALGNHSLNVIGKSGSASHIVPVTLSVGAAQPVAQQKIAEALQAGKLDYGTSLLYRAYALFGDRRLSSEYQGPSLEEDNGLFSEIRDALGTFPAAMQAQLQPFILRPADPASVWNATAPTTPSVAALHQTSPLALELPGPPLQAPPAQCPAQSVNTEAWASKRSATHPVRVWAQCQGRSDYDTVSQLLIDQTLVVLDKIYEPMTKLMGQPILDQEGGDDAIDFYLLDIFTYVFRRNTNLSVALGSTVDDDPVVNNGKSGFVLLGRHQVVLNTFHTHVIHEFFHVLQKCHNQKFHFRPLSGKTNVSEEHWFVEASAVWAEVYFDRELAPWENGRVASVRHGFFTGNFQKSSKALNAPASSDTKDGYRAYIWPYFVEQETGNSNFMQQIWAGLDIVTTFEQADDVIDSVYSFEKNFKTFALRNLNQPYLPGDPLPRKERYVSLDPDQFPDGVGPNFLPENSPGILKADLESSFPLTLDNLSASYVHLVVHDPKIQKVQFDFSQLQPAGFTDVQALVATTNGWVSKPLNLGSGTATFCFNKGPTTTEGPTTKEVQGSFIDIRLVVANHGKREGNKVAGNLTVRPKSAQCAPVYEGTTTFSGQRAGGFALIRKGSARVTWEPIPGGSGDYRVREGTVTIETPGDLGKDKDKNKNCPLVYPNPTKTMTSPSTIGQLKIAFSTTPPTYIGQGSTLYGPSPPAAKFVCPDSETELSEVIAEWFVTGSTNLANADGSELSGRVTFPDTIGGSAEEIVYTHSFKRVEE